DLGCGPGRWWVFYTLDRGPLVYVLRFCLFSHGIIAVIDDSEKAHLKSKYWRTYNEKFKGRYQISDEYKGNFRSTYLRYVCSALWWRSGSSSYLCAGYSESRP